ncbi:MAG: hypothetical protein EXR12_02455 [Rhodospirillaceae bacterium]|nr:hypothetical protein [Rhodospirillaceae bacterium]
MKRPFKPTVNYKSSLGLPDFDFTQEQFAGIGHVAMAYNEAEEQPYNLFGYALDMKWPMAAEVFTRIGGLDGIVAIIIQAAQDVGLSDREMEALRETVGEGGFGKYKKCRDAVLHARSYNSHAGIGYRLERRAKPQEVLMTAEALEILASHLTPLAHEIQYFEEIIAIRREQKSLDPADLYRASLAGEAVEWLVRFRDCRKRRLALPPLPEFPPEAELLSARGEWQKTLPSLKASSEEPDQK